MAGFAVSHINGIYKRPFTHGIIVRYQVVEGVYIPLYSIEDWFVLYQLIPGKEYKADLIENFFRRHGLSYPERFQIVVKQPMPAMLK